MKYCTYAPPPADYTAAKAGLIAFHASLAAELESSPSIKTILVTPGQLTTTLFEGVETPSNFLGPLVEPVEVAKEIVKAVDAGVSAELAMPLYSKWIQIMGMLPPGLKWLARKASRLDQAMDTYVSE